MDNRVGRDPAGKIVATFDIVLVDTAPEGLKFFGHDNGKFITLHLDYDVDYDAGPRGKKTARHLQNVRYHVGGNGNTNSAKIEHRWQVDSVE